MILRHRISHAHERVRQILDERFVLVHHFDDLAEVRLHLLAPLPRIGGRGLAKAVEIDPILFREAALGLPVDLAVRFVGRSMALVVVL